MAEEEVGFRLALKNRREVERGVHEVGDELDRTGDKAHRVGREARYGAAGMLTLSKSGRIAGRAVLYGTGAMAAGVVGLGIVTAKFTKDAVKGWEDHTKVVRQSRAVIKSTGGTANLTARQVGGLSDALERKTGVDGDVIQSGANMLLTFKNVRNEQGKGNKIFNQSLTVLNDMSAAMKTDASKSAIQLGKALNDPIKGVSALAKVGVTFSDGQKEQIENYVKQGKMVSAQKIILRELRSEFEGSAKANMTTGDQVMVGYHALQDTIGKAVIPLQQKFNRFLINDGIPAAQHYADVFARDGVPAIEKYAGIFERRGIPAIKNFADEARPVVESILPAIASGIDTAADSVKVIAPRLKSIFDSFNDLPDWAKKGILIGAGGAAVAKKLGAFSVGKSVLSGISSAKPLPVFVVNNGVPGVGSKNGAPVVTSDDRRKPQTRAGKVGNGVAAGAATILGPWIVDQAVAEAKWPWTEGPFKPDKWTGSAKEVESAQRMIDRSFKGATTTLEAYGITTDGVTGSLRRIPRDVRSQVIIDGLDPALVKVNNLRTSLLGLPALGTYGNGLGVLAPAGGPKKKHGKGSNPPAPTLSPRAAYPSVNPPQLDDDFFGTEGSASPRIEIPLHVDGREIARAVYDDMETRMANQ